MSEFINTADIIGDDEMCDRLIMRTVTEYKENRIASIRINGFRSCRELVVVDVPSVNSIERGAFHECVALTALILRGDTVCVLNTVNWSETFYNTPIKNGTGYIYVPRSLVDTYKAATNWSTYAAQIRAIEDYPDITGG